MLGDRLKAARIASGLSLRELAAQINGIISAQAIWKYERNEDMPSRSVRIALAAALNITEEYLLSGGGEGLVLEGVEFRKKKASSRETATIGARTIQLVGRYLALEDLLLMRSVDWEQPRSAPYRVLELRDADDAARSVRDDWSLGNDPIPNLAELLEERGIKVLSMELSDIDGLAAKVRRRGRDAARVIVVRKNTWSERKRFSLAHELAHMVISPASDVDAEKAAHRFAGAFLMPADAVRAEVGANRSSISIGELVSLKARFGVSIQAIAFRCKDLGIITSSSFSQLYRIFAKRGWRSPPYLEPATIPPEQEEPKRFERLCYRALAEKVIEKAHAAELLDISVRELDARLDQDGGHSRS